MVSSFTTRKIILNILPQLKHNDLSAKIYKVPLHCISAQTGYIALAMEFTKPQIISTHFKGGNSDSEYIPRLRQQHK